MKEKRTRDSIAKTIAQHHTALCLFAAAAELVEGPDIKSDYYVIQQRIAKLCRTAQQKCLTNYDREMAQLERAE